MKEKWSFQQMVLEQSDIHRTKVNPDLKLLLKTQHLCTSAKSNLRDRVLGEVEKNGFIALPGKGGHSGFMPLKTVCPSPGGFGEEFCSNGSRAGLLIRIRVCAGPALL